MARRLIIQTPLVASADAACIVPLSEHQAPLRQYRPPLVETATTYRKWKKIIAGGA
ncbi:MULTISPECIES: hypothetical protein [unclassified Bradyrhizobium]|uniref:hypothetical protein n=1 Tax=unclassified Bradyrhizobium TaxID=2631580 RepID=UPI0028EDA1C8|nr:MULTISPECIES: hypothetical protein [unclassified Bradyrhizobium]